MPATSETTRRDTSGRGVIRLVRALVTGTGFTVTLLAVGAVGAPPSGATPPPACAATTWTSSGSCTVAVGETVTYAIRGADGGAGGTGGAGGWGGSGWTGSETVPGGGSGEGALGGQGGLGALITGTLVNDSGATIVIEVVVGTAGAPGQPGMPGTEGASVPPSGPMGSGLDGAPGGPGAPGTPGGSSSLTIVGEGIPFVVAGGGGGGTGGTGGTGGQGGRYDGEAGSPGEEGVPGVDGASGEQDSLVPDGAALVPTSAGPARVSFVTGRVPIAPDPSAANPAAQGWPIWLQQSGRALDAACPLGWGPSWAEWARAATGGWVCTREVLAGG